MPANNMFQDKKIISKKDIEYFLLDFYAKEVLVNKEKYFHFIRYITNVNSLEYSFMNRIGILCQCIDNKVFPFVKTKKEWKEYGLSINSPSISIGCIIPFSKETVTWINTISDSKIKTTLFTDEIKNRNAKLLENNSTITKELNREYYIKQMYYSISQTNYSNLDIFEKDFYIPLDEKGKDLYLDSLFDYLRKKNVEINFINCHSFLGNSANCLVINMNKKYLNIQDELSTNQKILVLAYSISGLLLENELEKISRKDRLIQIQLLTDMIIGYSGINLIDFYSDNKVIGLMKFNKWIPFWSFDDSGIKISTDGFSVIMDNLNSKFESFVDSI